jgi:1,2-diacylglycerol 3-beta-glucosyltransferase
VSAHAGEGVVVAIWSKRQGRGPRGTVQAQPAVATTGSPWTLLVILGLLVGASAAIGFDWTVAIAAFSIEALFVAYFVRHLSFAIAALRAAPADLGVAEVGSDYLPPVSVLVACHNEVGVVPSVVEALAALQEIR